MITEDLPIAGVPIPTYFLIYRISAFWHNHEANPFGVSLFDIPGGMDSH